MRFFGLIGLSVALSSVSYAQTEKTPSATQLADSINKAGGSVSYAAVRRVSFRGPGGNRTFDERILRAKGKMYISFSSDSEFADQQIYEQGGKRYTYIKSTNEMRVSPIRGGFTEVVDMLKKADQEKKLKVSAGDAIAGRSTFYIEVPAGRGRGGTHRIWVDKTKFVVLKRSFGFRDDDEAGGYEYTVIDYSRRIPESKLALPKGAKIITVVDDLKRIASELGLKPMYIPNSGKREFVSVGQMDYRGKKIIRQFYVEGEKRLSLFVLKQTSEKIEFRGERVKGYQWNAGGLTLVLIGDYTESELKKLAQSVRAQ